MLCFGIELCLVQRGRVCVVNDDLLMFLLSLSIVRTPGLVAAYVIRTEEEVTASRDNRELTPVALYVPILPCFVLVGLWFSYRKQQSALQEDEKEATEVTGLLFKKDERRRSSVVTISQAFCRQSQVDGRLSAQIMGLMAYDTKDESDMAEKLQNDMEEWLKLAELDYEEDDENENLVNG